MTSFTREVTMLPKAAPMMTPTAMSRTLPFMANSLNSAINPIILTHPKIPQLTFYASLTINLFLSGIPSFSPLGSDCLCFICGSPPSQIAFQPQVQIPGGLQGDRGRDPGAEQIVNGLNQAAHGAALGGSVARKNGEIPAGEAAQGEEVAEGVQDAASADSSASFLSLRMVTKGSWWTPGICSTERRVSMPVREMWAICFICPRWGVVWIAADTVRITNTYLYWYYK